MASFTGVGDQVNGGVLAGDFLTGQLSFFIVATLVPMFQTNVTTPVALLYTQQGYSTWQSVTVTDSTGTAQTYASQASYTDALAKQQNLDLLVRTFATRANPIAISVSTATVSNPSAIGLTGYSYSTNFGSGYTSSATVTYVKFATERTGYWQVSGSTAGPDDNVDGYQLLDTLQAVPSSFGQTASVGFQPVGVQDLSTPILNTGFLNFETGVGSTIYRNTLAIISTL